MADDLPKRRSRKLPPMDENLSGNIEAAPDDLPLRRRRPSSRPPRPEAGPTGSPGGSLGRGAGEGDPQVGERPTSTEHLVRGEGGDGGGGQRRKKRKKRRPAPEGEEGPETGDADLGAGIGGADVLVDHVPKELAGDVETVPVNTLIRMYGSGRFRRPEVGRDVISPTSDVTGSRTELGDDAELAAATLKTGVVSGDAQGRKAAFKGEPTLVSQQTEHIFIEHKAGFKKQTLNQYQQQLEAERAARLESGKIELPSNLTRLFAVSFQRAFRIFTTLFHGLFAGFSVMHTIAIYMIPCASFIAIYGIYAHAISMVYYVLFVLLVVSACDRYDLARPTRDCCRAMATCRNAGIVVFIYMAGILVNESMYQQDVRLVSYVANATHWAAHPDVCKTLLVWRGMDAARTALLVLGWLVLSCSPMFDRLEENLKVDLDAEFEQDDTAAIVNT